MERASEQKSEMEAEGYIGKCSLGQMSFTEEAFGKVTLGLNTSLQSEQPTYEDIETGLHIYAILLFCPKETSKLGNFLQDLVSNASPRTLLLTVFNSIQS